MIIRTTSIAILAIAALSATVTTANASTFHHIDQIATRLEADTDTLVGEVATHYRHSPYYTHIISDTVKMKRLASHIHSVVHHEGATFHLQKDVAELDALFHHVERLIKQAEHHSRYSFHGGHIHGNTAHVCRGLKLIETDIHHLQQDLAILARPVHHVHSGHGGHNGHGGGPSFGGPSFGGKGFGGKGGGPQGHGGPKSHGGGRGNSVSIGRGGFQIRFGF